MRIIGFLLALGVWLFLVTYGLLAVTMGGCRAEEAGCDPTHFSGIAVVLGTGALGFIALVWGFLMRKAR